MAITRALVLDKQGDVYSLHRQMAIRCCINHEVACNRDCAIFNLNENNWAHCDLRVIGCVRDVDFDIENWKDGK